jgi:dihydrofolate reductase
VDDIRQLKNSEGGDLQVIGSGNLVQTLLKNDLVDEMRLMIFPITLGTGKHLFAEGTIAVAFEPLENLIAKNGVIFASYKRAGEVQTGTVGA